MVLVKTFSLVEVFFFGGGGGHLRIESPCIRVNTVFQHLPKRDAENHTIQYLS